MTLLLVEGHLQGLLFGGQPESNLTAEDFDDTYDSSNSSDDSEEQEDGENDEQDGKGSDDSEEQEDGENDEQDGEGGDESDEQEGDESNEELEYLKDKMDKSSAERDMSDWYNTEADYESPTKFIEDHFDNLQDMRAEPETEIGVRQKERDERMNNTHTAIDVEDIIELYEDRFADEIREAFRKIKTREAPKPAEYGQRINVRGVIRKRSGDPTEERLYLEMDQSEVGDRCITESSRRKPRPSGRG